MLKVVKCSICGVCYNGEEAGRHKNLTKHNNWELLLDASNELSRLANEQGVALDSGVVSVVIKDKTRR